MNIIGFDPNNFGVLLLTSLEADIQIHRHARAVQSSMDVHIIALYLRHADSAV